MREIISETVRRRQYPVRPASTL